MKISELTPTQREHMAWRLDHKTSCGMLTAMALARLEHGDLDVAYVFEKYGDRTPHSAKVHAFKCANFEVPSAGLYRVQIRKTSRDKWANFEQCDPFPAIHSAVHIAKSYVDIFPDREARVVMEVVKRTFKGKAYDDAG